MSGSASTFTPQVNISVNYSKTPFLSNNQAVTTKTDDTTELGVAHALYTKPYIRL